MTDASNPPGSRRAPQNEQDEEEADATVTLARYAPAAAPVLPFGGAAPPSIQGGEPPYAPAPPSYPSPQPPAPPPQGGWTAPASPWSTRAPMPRGLTPMPAADGAPPAPPQGSALGASNAAAAASAPWSPPRPAAPPAVLAVAPEPVESPAREVMRLIWFDEDAVTRIRRVPAYKPILDALDDGPLDRALDDPFGAPDPLMVEDRRAVFEIAARGSATDARGVAAALDSGIREGAKFVPPIVLVAGELSTPFDELAQLEATVAVTTPVVTSDDRELESALETAQRFLKGRGNATARSTARALTIRIREAFTKERKLSLTQLDEHVLRSLREERSFQRRDLLGEPHLRFLLHASDDPGEAPLVLYAPEAVARSMPMYTRFSARVIAEVHLQEDESEVTPGTLRALALVRRVPRPA